MNEGARPEATQPFAGVHRHSSLWRAIGLLRPEGKRLSISVLLGAASAISGVALLGTSAWLIARAAQHPSIVALGVAIVGVRFFAISRGVLRYCQRVVGHDTALRVLSGVRVRVYESLEALVPSGLPAFRRGDLLARLVQDVDSIQDLMLGVISPYGVAILTALPAIALTWYVLPTAGLLLSIALIGAIVFVPLETQLMAKRRKARQAAARGDLSTCVVDLLEGATDLVAFGAVDDQLSRASAADGELARISNATTSRTSGVGSALITLLSGIVVWSVLAVGIPSVDSGRLRGPLLAVIALVPLAIFEAVTGLPAAGQVLASSRQAAARVFEVMDTAPPVTDPATPQSLNSSPHTLRIRGLRARYGARGEWALDGIDLDLTPGRRVGIVGPSGAGKSTLAGVLLRFLPYENGSVTLDGKEVNSLAGEEVRRVIGLAAQDNHVFDTTIRENIMLAQRDATEAALRDALERARLLDWVAELPDGLDTEVGRHGIQLSGGQRQRLAVARALLAHFYVLVLDEPGEHLDNATADALTADLLDLTRGQSTVIISHRLAGMEDLDEILVLDAGRVVERGTHAELLQSSGPYACQWQRERRLDAELDLIR